MQSRQRSRNEEYEANGDAEKADPKASALAGATAYQPAYPLRVVVLNWNLAADTLACVQSLLIDGFQPADILVMDNGSTAGRGTLAAGLPPGVGQLYLPQNVGFAAGSNVGIAAALDTGAAWLLLLNNDTLVERGARRALLDAAATDTFALLSPLILYSDPPPRVWSLGDRRIMGTLLTRSLWRNQPPPTQLPPLLEVDFLTACALMVRADVFARVGLLDEGYFMYAEDADFCLRASRAGFHLGCATEARIAHKVSRSTGSTHPAARRWRIFYQARFYRLHAGPMQRLLLLMPYTLARSLLMAGCDLLAGRSQMAAATLQGWLSGWVRVHSPGHNATGRSNSDQ